MDDQNEILDSIPAGPNEDRGTQILKGILYVITYYIVGLGLAGLSYNIIGHPYAHAPGLHHLILLMTFAGGILWTIGAALKHFTIASSWTLKGILFTNIFAIAVFAAILYSELSSEETSTASSEEEISMSKNGDTTVLYYNDNIIYVQIGDSVQLNFIDSARFQKIVDSTGRKIREE